MRHVKCLIHIELTFIEAGLSNSWASSVLLVEYLRPFYVCLSFYNWYRISQYFELLLMIAFTP